MTRLLHSILLAKLNKEPSIRESRSTANKIIKSPSAYPCNEFVQEEAPNSQHPDRFNHDVDSDFVSDFVQNFEVTVRQ